MDELGCIVPLVVVILCWILSLFKKENQQEERQRPRSRRRWAPSRPCPKCEFTYAFDGQHCEHCGYVGPPPPPRFNEPNRVVPVEGVHWVDSGEKGVAGECQVCGMELRGSVVLCKMCRTPHHRDCWEYMGSCSTYACEETRYDVSQ